jgi:uncharacterized YigZ family protein
MDDTYRTISSPSEGILFKEKNSKFYGYAIPVTTEEDVKSALDKLKKRHANAGHFCYAYQIGTENKQHRVNDDGEPNNSAGMPIYNQLLSYDVTNILIVVIRYFGGVKLGVGGLITAYKTAAQLTLEEAEIIEKTIDIYFSISFEYKNMNKVMRIIKEKNIDIISQNLHESCEIIISTRKKNAELVFDIFSSIFEIDIKKHLN